jgi:hypothetical protein
LPRQSIACCLIRWQIPLRRGPGLSAHRNTQPPRAGMHQDRLAGVYPRAIDKTFPGRNRDPRQRGRLSHGKYLGFASKQHCIYRDELGISSTPLPRHGGGLGQQSRF